MVIYNGQNKKQKTYNTRDSSIQLDLDYNSKFVRKSFIWNATQALNSLEMYKKIVPDGRDFNKFVRSRILEKYSNKNL